MLLASLHGLQKKNSYIGKFTNEFVTYNIENVDLVVCKLGSKHSMHIKEVQNTSALETKDKVVVFVYFGKMKYLIIDCLILFYSPNN